ncbi:hypothetical protein diail_2687 [Diaporthe ilicicola]|nr:hypothetical protein diail_2687 [Diaporthe ilicicola]
MATINQQTGGANEAATNTKTGPDEARTDTKNDLNEVSVDSRNSQDVVITVHINTIHEECHGLIDPEGPTAIGIGPQQMAENLFCEDQDEEVNLGPLSTITMEDLKEAIEEVIEKGGDHNLEGLADRNLLSFDFIPEEEGKVVQSLFNISDEELQRVLAGGKGVVRVAEVDDDHNDDNHHDDDHHDDDHHNNNHKGDDHKDDDHKDDDHKDDDHKDNDHKTTTRTRRQQPPKRKVLTEGAE